MKKTSLASHYLRAIALFVVGLVLFLMPAVLSFQNAHLGILLATFGSLLLGSAIVDALFQMRFQRQMQEQVDTLRTNISTLQDTVMIAKGAVEAGLTAVYATREECLREIKEKIEGIIQNIDNNKRPEKVEISILGISLGDFLCPHGFLQPTFRRILKEDAFHIRVTILADGCNAALYRAIREESGKFGHLIGDMKDYKGVEEEQEFVEIYQNTKCHDELKTATDYLRDLASRKTIDRDTPAKDEAAKAFFEAYTYSEHPMAFIFVLDEDMFIENYHLAGRGGEAPILQVSKYKKQTSKEESKLYKIFMGHYESVIQMSKKVEAACEKGSADVGGGTDATRNTFDQPNQK